MRVRKLLSLLAVVAVVGVLPVPASLAQPAGPDTLTIPVGFDLSQHPQSGGAPAESMRFLAPELNVNKDDVLTFQGFFHTATALPVNTEPDAWLMANAAPGGPYFNFVADDEGANSLKWNEAVVFPTGNFECGIGTAPPCDYSGTDVVNSGLLFFSTGVNTDVNPPALTGGFSMTVDANPGDSFWIICLVHPNMRLKVNVVPANDPSTTQGDIDAYALETTETDAENANALHQEYSKKRQSRKLSNGRRVHQAWTGVDYGTVGGGISLFDIYPRKIELKRGDKIKYNFDQLLFEDHTSTHPRSKAIQLSNNSFVVVCDPDGSGSRPDEDAAQDGTCPAGTVAEIDSTPQLGAVLGDGVVKSKKDVESSGIHGFFAGQDPWTVRMRLSAGDETKFVCALHTFMVQKIVTR